MKALVVYESMYGNTAQVGEAIAGSLRAHGLAVDAGSISRIDAEATAGVHLLVVGGPTHAHGMSWTNTRKTAIEDAKNTFPDPTTEPGLRGWMNDLPAGAGRQAAAFDTRFDKPVAITGSAAKGIARKLAHHGFVLEVEPESFFVTGENRLEEGQIERATDWAARLAERATADTTSPSG